MSKLWTIALTLLVAASSLLTSGPQAAAGWGHHWHHGWGYYPGWSAWSYPAWGFSRVTTYSVGPGWGYAHGLGCWPRHRYYSYYGPRVINYSVGWPSIYYAPATYYYPTYDIRVVAPVPVAPTVCLPTPLVSRTTSAQSTLWQTALRTPASPAPLARGLQDQNGLLVVRNTTKSKLANMAPANQALRESAVPGRLVAAQAATNSATPVPLASTAPDLPLDLLQRTDALFARGQYAEAAAAYARLTVSYGNHDALAVRRFIALVASGDCHQAAVIFELASASGQVFAPRDLPTGGLVTLYGSLSDNRRLHVEALAEHALKNADDGLALAMVGTWLQLDGQTQRAQPFMERAAALAPASAPVAPPANSSSHLAAASFSR